MGSWNAPNLKGTVAVVTGASRGVGRGTAEVLGECGATVYVTGRSTRGGPTTDALPGTVDEVAAAVTQRGGVGIPAPCDHTVDEQVESLFARVGEEQGRLDLLVNNVWGGYERYGDAPFDAPFWKQPLWRWEGMFAAGARAHFLASRFAAPLLIRRARGLIINISSGDGDRYRGNVIYDAAKTATERLAFGMGRELRQYGVAVLAVRPGFTRTERVLAAYGGDLGEDFALTESPAYTGRAVACLTADPRVLEKTGGVFAAGELALKYGFTDVDGRQMPTFRFPEDGDP